MAPNPETTPESSSSTTGGAPTEHPASIATTSGTSSSLPSSQSTGSLQNLTTATSTTSEQRRPLVNRISNAIISTEEDDDSVDGTLNTELDEHLKASMTYDMMADAASAVAALIPAPSAVATAGSPETPQITSAVPPEAEAIPPTVVNSATELGKILNGIQKPDNNVDNNKKITSPTGQTVHFHTEAVEMSLSEVSSSINMVNYQPKMKGDSPVSSRHLGITSYNSQDSSSIATPQLQYIPSTLSNMNTALSDMNVGITPNNSNVTLTPTSTITTNNSSNNSNPDLPTPLGRSGHSKIPSNASFDFDASQSNRKRGTGYLASQISLATPTDVFASGCTLLQLCAIGNLPSVKEYVSTTFANVNFRDYDRRTALHVAASEGHLDVVKYLVAKGGNVNRSDRWGGSPLDDAHRHRHADVARYLRSKGGKTGSLNLTSNLIAAAAAGDIEEVTLLCTDVGTVSKLVLDLSGSRRGRAIGLGTGSPVLVDNDLSSSEQGRQSRGGGNQRRPKRRSTFDGSGSGSGALLEISENVPIRNSIDINNGDYDKRTALHLAAGEGHLDVVKFLCKRGADVNVEDRWGGKPLDDALQRGHERVAEVLRKYGAKNADDVLQHHRNSTSGVGGSDHARPELLAEDENLRVDFSELEMIERIGSGAFGEIYKCRWRGILVAAKCIKASKIQKEWILKNRSGSRKDHIANRVEAIKQASITDEEKQLALEDFRRETAIMRRLRHPNIVMMLAYSHTEDVEVMISEICRCSLLDIFKANNISKMQIPKRTQIIYAQQLAQGMNHLHKSRPPIIHRDLKPANLLIDFSGTIKIADFGLAKIRPNPEQNESEAFLMTGETGSYRFMAPEVFRHEEYTQTVDVYSYAMIFYYMLRSTPPWAGLSGLDAVTKAAVDGERPLIPRNVDERLSTLLKRCWDENHKARPSFDEILRCLNIYSHDVFKTNDRDVQMSLAENQESKCGCVIS